MCLQRLCARQASPPALPGRCGHGLQAREQQTITLYGALKLISLLQLQGVSQSLWQPDVSCTGERDNRHNASLRLLQEHTNISGGAEHFIERCRIEQA